MLHAVDAGSPAAMATGRRVRARWAASPAGHISDIACFDPCPAEPARPAGAAQPGTVPLEDVPPGTVPPGTVPPETVPPETVPPEDEPPEASSR